MAQAFVTTYKNYYRWPDIDKRKSLRPVDKFAQELPKGDIWIIPKKIGEDDEEGGQSLQAALAAIGKMYRTRLWSTYQMSYCSDMLPKPEKEEEEDENALLSYGKALYGPKKIKIPPPLPSTRRINGYIRPTRMYTPLSAYQHVHGRVGYGVLDTNARLAAKVQSSTSEIQKENTKALVPATKQENESPPTAKTDEKNINKKAENKRPNKLDSCDCGLTKCR